MSRKAKVTRFRRRLEVVIFGADTPLGKLFDVVLLWAIVLSVALVILESVPSIKAEYGPLLRVLEWSFTGLFTIEYVARLYAARHPLRYAFSFFGVVDFLAVVPGYLSLVIVGSQYLLAVRALRLLRIFRVLKLSRYLGEISVLTEALRASRFKITVFSLHRTYDCRDYGLGHVPRRRAAKRLYQHPHQHLLGYCYANHGRLRRHLTANSTRPDDLIRADDYRLRHHRCADGDRHSRTEPRSAPWRPRAAQTRAAGATAAEAVRAVPLRTARPGRRLLQALRRALGSAVYLTR